MYAFNNASEINTTESIYVREHIDGVDITGCSPNDVSDKKNRKNKFYSRLFLKTIFLPKTA